MRKKVNFVHTNKRDDQLPHYGRFVHLGVACLMTVIAKRKAELLTIEAVSKDREVRFSS